MKKKILIIMIIVAVLLILGSLISTIILGSNTSKLDERELKIKNELFSKTITKKELERILNKELSPEEFALGKDSFINNIPTEVTKEVEEEYKPTQRQCVKNVNKKILDNLNYSFENNKIKVNTWNYYEYVTDLINLKILIEKKANVNTELMTNDIKQYYEKDYQAQIVALRIMDSYLEDYNSKKESEVSLDDNNNYYQIYIALIREPSTEIEAPIERVNTIYEKAVKDKLIDEKAPLKLITN